MDFERLVAVLSGSALPVRVGEGEATSVALDDVGPRPMTNTESVAVLVRAVVRAAEFWKLFNPEAAALFDVPPVT